MFRVCSHQLKISLCSPRIYIAVFAGIVIQIVSLISFLDFSKTIGKPLCVFESITYSNCDLYAPVALFLAVWCWYQIYRLPHKAKHTRC